MELRQLRYFVAVAETGNISVAAKKIFLTQPALSRQIKSLEDAIGQDLFERRAHSIHLTSVGEALLPEARELLQHADQMLERVRRNGQGVKIRIGYAPSLASGILSVAVENFTQKHPTAKVELFDLSTGELLEGLKNDKLDIILTVADETKTREVKWTTLIRTPWKLAVPRKHPFAGRESITPDQMAREPLLIFCKRDYPEYSDAVTAWLNDHKQCPNVAAEYDGAASLMTAVESGQGVAVVTARTAQLFQNQVQFITLSPGPKPLCIAAGFRTTKGDHQPISVLIEELRLAAQAVK